MLITNLVFRFSFLVSYDSKLSRLVSSWLSVPFWFLSSIYSIYLRIITSLHASSLRLSCTPSDTLVYTAHNAQRTTRSAFHPYCPYPISAVIVINISNIISLSSA